MSEREKFEAWFKEKYQHSAEYFKMTKFDESVGFYRANDLYNPDSSVAAWVLRASFDAWQAARADLLEDIELNKLADAAKTQKRVRVNLEDL